MATSNDITGDALRSRPVTNKYRDNYDSIFKKKESTPKENENSSNDDKAGDA